MTDTQQKAAAKQFVKDWLGKGYEKGHSQPFWIDLLSKVYGVENPAQFIIFEEQVRLDHTSFIDGFIPSTHVLIEQKGIGKDLRKAIRQSDGSLLTPFQQAKRYSQEIPYSQRPRWIVTCNFEEFHVYDMERPTGDPEVIYLKDLEKEYYRLQFLVDTQDEHVQREERISKQAGVLVKKIYNALLAQYNNPGEDEKKSLNMLCVRLVFCLYAEDAGVFGGHGKFHDYLRGFHPKNVRKALIDLFAVLNTEEHKRDRYMNEDLLSFPYVNGGLFADSNIIIPRFTEEIVDLLLGSASEGFDWSEISPTIFGALFESTLGEKERHDGGMHYTPIENIHWVIDPLFLDELNREFEEIAAIAVERTKQRKLEAFQKKLASLTFLDPACGSGNFLTETYISLRRLENQVIAMRYHDQMVMGDSADFNPIQVSISQFYGIEIHDYAVAVAKTALWIAESQMMKETAAIVSMEDDFLPLKTAAHIVEGNALRMDWETVVPKRELDYIMGNPPFVGARLMNSAQKEDVNQIFRGWKNAGNLDYVACWYKKTTDMMAGTRIRSALVSTNSVTQGEAVANLWKPLFEQGVHIDFAYRTFIWDSEAKIKAHVHCVIVGFSIAPCQKERMLFTVTEAKREDGTKQYIVRRNVARNINAYLLDAPNVFIESRNKSLCHSPSIGIGNKPIDDGNYLFSKEEMVAFIKCEPASAKYFRPWLGAREFINNSPRYCLWLGDCPPDELRRMPECMKRVRATRDFRLASLSAGTVKLASTPTRFHVENMPSGYYVLIPCHSSETRKYIPMGYVSPNVLSSNATLLVTNASLYHFGILNSTVHMAWVCAVCGRIKSDYRYSKDVVYNNFPWPTPTEAQKDRIAQTAQAILDARAKYPNSSLADLYDETAMPPELRTAHQQNDKAVMQAYGFWGRLNIEAECVAELMRMYQALTK